MGNNSVNVVKITNGFIVYYQEKQYYCKSIAQVSKLLKDIFPDA